MKSKIPATVPRLLLITSRREESRMGRYDWVNSMARLRQKPRSMAIQYAFGGEESSTYCYFMMRNKLLWAEKNLPIGGRLMVYRHAFGELFRCVTPPRMSWNSNGKGLSFETICNWLIVYKETFFKKYRKPANKAELLGARDYVLRRFGNCPKSVRSLGK